MRLETDEQPVFVVQLPSYVIDRWKQAEDTTLAKLTIQGGAVPSVSLQLQGDYAHDLPKNFSGTVSLGGMKLFEETEEAQEDNAPSMRISGPVLQMKTQVQMRTRNPQTGEMELDRNVMRLAREKDAEEKRRAKSVMTQELPFAPGRNRRQPLPSLLERKRKKQLYNNDKSKKEKRSRCDKSDLETMLFALFDTRDKWKLTSLQKRTNQPSAWLKDVLSDIADLHYSGPFSGLYELKPEFQRNKAEPDPSQES